MLSLNVTFILHLVGGAAALHHHHAPPRGTRLLVDVLVAWREVAALVLVSVCSLPLTITVTEIQNTMRNKAILVTHIALESEITVTTEV